MSIRLDSCKKLKNVSLMKFAWKTIARRDVLKSNLIHSIVVLVAGRWHISFFPTKRGNSSIAQGASSLAKKLYCTRARLASAGSTAKNLDCAFLSEVGREGLFVFSASDLSAKVTSDPEQGVYVAPDSDATGATGAWVRQFDNLIPEYFGSVGNGTSTPATATISAWIDYAKANGIREIKASGRYYLPAGKQTVSDYGDSKGHPSLDFGSYYAVIIDGASDLTIDLSGAQIKTDHGTAICIYASLRTYIIKGKFGRTGQDADVIANQPAAISIIRSQECVGSGQIVDGYYRNLMVYRALESGFEDYDSRNALYFCAYAASVIDIQLLESRATALSFLRRGVHVGGRYGGAFSDESEVSDCRFYDCSPRGNVASHIKTEIMNVRWSNNEIYESAAQNSGNVINGISAVPALSIGTASRAVIFNNKVRGCYIGINVRGLTDFQIIANDVIGYYQTGLALVSDRLGGSDFAVQRGVVTQNHIGPMADDSIRKSKGNDKNAGLQIEKNIAAIRDLFVGQNTVDAKGRNIKKTPEYGLYVEADAKAVDGLSTNKLIGSLKNVFLDRSQRN